MVRSVQEVPQRDRACRGALSREGALGAGEVSLLYKVKFEDGEVIVQPEPYVAGPVKLTAYGSSTTLGEITFCRGEPGRQQ